MTSETTADASRKWRLRCVAYASRLKPKIGWLCLVLLAILVLWRVAPAPTTISCNDPSIRQEVMRSTVSVKNVFIASLLVPLLEMALFEYLVPPPGQTPPNTTPLRACLRRSWGYFTDLFIGVLFTYFFTDLLKTTVGEARPNFWGTCQPNLTEAQCAKEYITVTWRDCTNPLHMSHWGVTETLKSFPSGHASVSVNATVFMIVYTHKRLWKRWSSLLSPWLQIPWLTFAVICCQSRVWDKKHFWWDVLAGAAIGAVGGVLTVHFLTDWFERQEYPYIPSTSKEDSPPPSSSSSYIPKEEEKEGENSSSFSRTSTKRLITGGEKGGGGGGGGSE